MSLYRAFDYFATTCVIDAPLVRPSPPPPKSFYASFPLTSPPLGMFVPPRSTFVLQRRADNFVRLEFESTVCRCRVCNDRGFVELPIGRQRKTEGAHLAFRWGEVIQCQPRWELHTRIRLVHWWACVYSLLTTLIEQHPTIDCVKRTTPVQA